MGSQFLLKKISLKIFFFCEQLLVNHIYAVYANALQMTQF